jgi:hypothetical protein
MSLHKLVFDTTDAASIADSANVGAYIRADDGTLISATGTSLDVNLTNASIAVTATDLDIRDLSHTQDSVKIGDGTDFLAIAADGSIAVTDNGGSLTVDATNLDIRDLAFATDKVDVTGSSVSITGDVNVTQGTSPWVVSATNLDIRDLVAATDSVSSWTKDGSGTSITSTVAGAKQALDVNIAASDIEINVENDWANIALTTASSTVTTTSAALFASPLADRRFVWMCNNGSKVVYVGPSGVSTANGFPLFPGSMLDARIGPAVAVHSVSSSGSQDVRVMQAS